MGELPAINQLVEVVVGPEVVFRSRVEDRDGDLFAIAAPTGAGDVEPPEDGAVMELAWAARRARYGVPVRLLERTRAWPPRWSVLVTGTPGLRNRRRFVRGGGSEPVTVYAVDRDPEAAFVGRVVDLSEGGTRCRLHGADLVPDEAVQICIALPEITVRMVGTVLALRAPQDPPGTRAGVPADAVDVVVTHEPPEPVARLLRRHVLAWELAERNGGPSWTATRPLLLPAPAEALPVEAAAVEALPVEAVAVEAVAVEAVAVEALPVEVAAVEAVPVEVAVSVLDAHHEGARHPSTLTSRSRPAVRPTPGTTPPNRHH